MVVIIALALGLTLHADGFNAPALGLAHTLNETGQLSGVEAARHLCVQNDKAREFPGHWGEPPAIQTRDLRPLPGGYELPENDLIAEDFRSRDKSWDYCRIALDFYREHGIPFAEMRNHNALIGNAKNDNSKYCFAKPGEVYLVYLPNGGTSALDLTGVSGNYTVKWFNPRAGGELLDGSIERVEGGGVVSIGKPPTDAKEDCLVVIR